jgi:hypothetical protein
MASSLPVIKKLVKRMITATSVFNVLYIVIRFDSSEQRKPPANSYYIFDVSPSPVYELIVLSQVHFMAHLYVFEMHFQTLITNILTGHKRIENITDKIVTFILQEININGIRFLLSIIVNNYRSKT